MKRERVDWELVRSRLQVSERMLAEALIESPERIRAAYRRRATKLAELPTEHRRPSIGQFVLVFRLAQERYGIELSDIAETLLQTSCTPVPGAPPHFQGVMNLRGELRAVVDLNLLLGRPATDQKDTGFVLILSRPGRQIGLRVDRVEGVREVRSDEVIVSGGGKYTRGIASGALILLSVDAVLAEVFSKGEPVT